MVMVVVAPLAKSPTNQLSAVVAVGVALTKVYPVGSISLTFTLVALLGPLFVAVMVKVTFVPIVGALLLTVLTTDKSVLDTGVGVTVLELFPDSGSGSAPVIVAMLV